MTLQFISTHCLVAKAVIDAHLKNLLPELERMNKVKDRSDERSSTLLPDDKKGLRHVLSLAKNLGKVDYLVVVGIGGSNLGTIAVAEAVLGGIHNWFGKPTVFFADTVDSDSIENITRILQPELKKGKKVVINGVSKSGSTTETIANFEIFVSLLKKYRKDYEKYVVVTTDYGSKYWELAQAEGFALLEIPKKVGGRYSVFSAVGLFPLALVGINVKQLLNGAVYMRNACLQASAKNPAAVSAIIQYEHYKQCKNISDTFLFSNSLEGVGKWYRQLMGESLGKEFDSQHNRVLAGITPTVSIGSTDLHSMAQLYLGGPYDKFTTFVTVKKSAAVKTPVMHEYDALVSNIQGKKLSSIMEAIVEGVKLAYERQKRPFCEIVLPDKKEHAIGQLLQMKMMEIMYLGFLMNVNPFDQPNVEDYKKETKRILASRR